MKEIPKMETGAFKTQQYKRSWRPVQRVYSAAKRKNIKKGSKKLGFLVAGVAASALILSVALSGTTVVSDFAKSASNVLNYEISLDETFGKLKFVGNSITEVFSPQKSFFISPISLAKTKSEYDTQSATTQFFAGQKTDVCAAADGIVINVFEKDGLFCVEIDHGQGMKTKTSLLSSACVENNQPIRQGDAIGVTDEKIELELLLNGEKTDATQFISQKAK